MSAQDERAPRAAARTGAASRLPIDPAPLAVPERLRDAYVRWARFLNDEVTFGLDDDGLHTKRHCARVLLLCLLIAEREGLSADEAETLCACAVFHDSRRNDDGLDVGHGARAAAYYRDLSAEAGWAFRPTSYAIMAYHDRDDALGEDEVSKSGGYECGNGARACASAARACRAALPCVQGRRRARPLPLGRCRLR